MVFRPRKRRQTLDLSIKIDNNYIECVKETVFLGVILQKHLSWKPHILNVARKISNSIDIINTNQVFTFQKPSYVFCTV